MGTEADRTMASSQPPGAGQLERVGPNEPGRWHASAPRRWATRLGTPDEDRGAERLKLTPCRILLVEDSAGDAALIDALLTRSMGATRLQISVEIVRNVGDATAALPGRYDLILLDLGLPDGCGIDVLARVRGPARDIPIVVLTGADDADLPRMCLEQGAQDYVCKQSLDSESLRRSIEYALARTRAAHLERRLEHADRLAAVGQLAATVAHEVNNPAAFVRLNSEDLLQRIEDLARFVATQRRSPDPQQLTAWLDEARTMLLDNIDGVDRVTRLVRDLRSFSKNEGTEAVEIDVTELCRSTLNVVSHHVRHRAQLSVRYGQVPPVLGDPQRLGQVVMNLVVNAAQAIDGPRIDNEVRVETRFERGEVVIEVADTGVGVPEHLRARIFEPFYSTKPGPEGTGLGLPICVEIVESFNGTLSYDSTEGLGSRFIVRLPPLRRPEVPAAARGTGRGTERGDRLRVLMIDDEERILDAMQRGLSRFHEVRTCLRAEDALARLSDEPFDVITCDLMMPGLDGIDFIQSLASSRPDMHRRVIVVTGGAANARAARFLETCELPILIKPVSLRELREAVEAHADATAHASSPS